VYTIGEFIGRVPDRPPLREQCRLVFGPVYELPVVQQMRRLSSGRLEVDVRQEAAILPLRVWGQVEQGMEEAPGEVFVVIAHRGKARKRPGSRWRCFKRKYVFFSR
jgi:hypothetical protein